MAGTDLMERYVNGLSADMNPSAVCCGEKEGRAEGSRLSTLTDKAAAVKALPGKSRQKYAMLHSMPYGWLKADKRHMYALALALSQ